MPVNEQARQSFADANKPQEKADPPDADSPAKQQEPEAVDGDLVTVDGEGSGGGGRGDGDSGGDNARNPGADAQAASENENGGGDGGGGGDQQAAAKKYNFKVGGVDFQIEDDGDAKVTVPEKKLWSEFGPNNKHSMSWSMPIPGIPVPITLKVKGNVNYRLQVGDGELQETTIQKRGSVYTIDSGIDTSVFVGLGVGAAASVGVDLWLIDAGAGIQGSASIGGSAKVKSRFRVEYDSSTKQFKAAAYIKTGKMKLPIEAKCSAFVYLDTIATSTWKASWPLIEANLGSLIVGSSKASLKYQTGQGLDFDLQKPSFEYSKQGREISFFGKRNK